MRIGIVRRAFSIDSGERRAFGAVLALVAAAGSPVAQPEARDGRDMGEWRLPFAFVENRGQWPTEARYVARLGGVLARMEPAAVVLQREAWHDDGPSRGVLVRLGFEGARAGARIGGEERLPGHRNYFLGRDPASWRTEVPAFASVRYEDLYEGIDLRVREALGRFEYDLLFASGANPEAVVLSCEGIEGMEVDGDGSLVLETALGPIRQRPPVTWQVLVSGERRFLDAGYRLLGGGRFGFVVRGLEADLPLVIDPGLEWASYLGTADVERLLSIAQGASGEPTVTGWTVSPAFPTTPGAYDPSFNGTGTGPSMFGDAFVARFTAGGSALVYATFLGGSDNDVADEVDVLGADAFVSGWTQSTDYPTTPGAFDTSHNGNGLGPMFGGGDLFVTRLNATGTALVYSTFIGGNDLEYVISMDVGPTGEATVAGHVHSTDFPVTPGAYLTVLARHSDLYVTRLNAAGSALVSSTFYGGLLGEDYPYALFVHPTGETTVVGTTNSLDLPMTPGAYDTTFNGGSPGTFSADVFALRFDAAAALLWATYLGGSDDDASFGVGVDASGAVTLTGYTLSGGFPTTPGAHDTTHNGSNDVFVTRLGPGGGSLVYSTFLGGSSWEQARGIALDATGSATVGGDVFSFDFPATPGAYATTGAFNGDGFVARLDMLPSGAAKFGSATPGCSGPSAIGVSSIPQVGNGAFAITCTNAPPSSPGILGLGGGALGTPVPVLGVSLWIDTSGFFVGLPAGSDAAGSVSVPIPIAPSPALAGGSVAAQFGWVDCGTPPLSASNGLTITVQP